MANCHNNFFLQILSQITLLNRKTLYHGKADLLKGLRKAKPFEKPQRISTKTKREVTMHLLTGGKVSLFVYGWILREFWRVVAIKSGFPSRLQFNSTFPLTSIVLQQNFVDQVGRVLFVFPGNFWRRPWLLLVWRGTFQLSILAYLSLSSEGGESSYNSKQNSQVRPRL